MQNETMARRHLLGRAGLAVGGAVAATAVLASPAHAAERDDASITGGWMTNRVDPAINVRARGIWTFSAGGVVHYQDIFVLNALLHGSWVGGPGRTFRYEMWGAFPPDPTTGAPGLTARVAGAGTYTRRSLTSPYVVTLFEPTSDTEVFRYDGTATATRIEP